MTPPAERTVVLVDAANVVGSRPTGWWRDRPGAARSLVERISAAVSAAVSGDHLAGPVVVVLEGAARAGAPEDRTGPVEVVHAERSGDDALVDLAASAPGPVLLVTADRELGRRARAVGAEVVGPSWLWGRL